MTKKNLRFVVEHLFQVSGREHVYVLVRALGSHDFSLGDAQRLGDVSIHNWVDQPRAVKPDGSADLDVFAFVLSNPADRGRLHLGQIVELS